MRAALGAVRERALGPLALLIAVVAFGLLGSQVRDAVSSATACAAQPGRATEARALLLAVPGQDAAMDAWEASLRAEGIPFERVTVGRGGPTGRSLGTTRSVGRFQFVVSAAGAREALGRAAVRRLDRYERRFGVREILASSPPLDRRGRPLAAAQRPLGGSARLSPEGRRTFSNLNATIPLDRAPAFLAERSGRGPVDALVRSRQGAPLVTVARLPDGRERLAVSLFSAPELHHSLLLSHGLIGWATRGVHVGLWRAYLAVQVDDVLLGNARWDPRSDRTAPDLPIEMTADDVRAAARWSRRERFRLDLAYNGGGAERSEDGAPCDPVLGALVAERATFGEENHTYDHLNLNELSADRITEQITRNVGFARRTGLGLDEPRELITGEHSGLRNPAMPEALERAGIAWIASDATREPVQRRLGPALTVPRNAPNVFYDVGTRAEQVDQYNFRYLESCRRFCLERPVDWRGYVRTVGRDVAGLVFRNDPRPSYVHQSNLAEDRNLLPVLSEALRRIRGAVSAELRQPTLSEAGEVMRRQIAWRQALARGEVRAVVDRRGITLRAARELFAPLTGTTAGEVDGAERSGWVRLPAGRSVTFAVNR